MQKFTDFNFPQELQAALAKMQFTTPTPIQSQAIPVALEGRDILGSAQTGTGKTAAFLLPLIAKLMDSKKDTALILTPTRELAKQVFDFAIKVLGRNTNIRAALLIGGAPIFPQLRQLSQGARLIIGTPGRVNDHLGRNEMLFANTRFLVLDETDMMLDMGFSEQINEILQYVPQQRQTLLFSATLPDPILKLSAKYLINPQRIAIGEVRVANNIVEDIVYTTKEEKYNELVKALDNKTGAVIVFVKTKIDAESLAKKLQKQKHEVEFLHGGLRQSRRDRVTKDFRNKGFRIMIATDVAARGLDIPHIEHVINYDMPESHDDYIHRIGRTARAQASGHALSLLTSRQRVNSIREFFDLGNARPARSGRSSRSGGGFGSRRGAPRGAGSGEGSRRFGGDRSRGFGGGDEGSRGFGSSRPSGTGRRSNDSNGGGSRGGFGGGEDRGFGSSRPSGAGRRSNDSNSGESRGGFGGRSGGAGRRSNDSRPAGSRFGGFKKRSND